MTGGRGLQALGPGSTPYQLAEMCEEWLPMSWVTVPLSPAHPYPLTMRGGTGVTSWV